MMTESTRPSCDCPDHPPAFAARDIDLPLAERALQDELLQGVSRTFALTIPQLPERLGPVVGNAYLLCRIVDTIEDEPTLNPERKRDLCRQFVDAVKGSSPVEPFADELAACLSEHTIPAEHELIRNAPRVVGITHHFNATQREALCDCVSVMADGMMEFQDAGSVQGLSDRAQLDRYCYHVAGVVGEMLTRLFCDYSPDIARHRERMMRLSVEFGQGLQMTNILKDIWDDRARGVCWLPRDVFAEVGFELGEMNPDHDREAFGRGLERLIGIAHGYLRNALTYTLLIPRSEAGIRRFCLWAIGMAVLTLRKINRRRDFRSGHEVKISRRAVGATMATTRLAVTRDALLKSLFHLLGTGLPSEPCRSES